ncbi:uncharacterized protein ELE39_001370 [Cryptosporidium sp. chipmunk genotype I]|uniref:uncharacterized protein n=1 Tax=Cryptosporidium sp. chipmunk genotype I TaxID=1280935 RepID=UPI00351AA820|nr:hypothetical protein ELE39_001370 [Cryptosporidium sp. chipmunk genotype I]
MNNCKSISCHIFLSLVFIISAVLFNANIPSHEKFIQFNHSYAKIRDDYTRLDIERGSDLVRKSREALQMSIFTYFMAQKKFSEVRILGAHPDSNEYRIAEDYYRYALNGMKMARDDWENNLKSTPVFTYTKDHVTNNRARAKNYDLNSLLLFSGRGYSGERGIDFQMDIYEDSDPIYLPIPTQKKLTQEIINNLNLGFQFNDLPPKLMKSINDRENNRKQNRLGNKDRQVKNNFKSISSLGNLNFGNNKFGSELFNLEKTIGNYKDDDYLVSADNYLEDKSPTNQFGTPDFKKSKEFLDTKSKNNHIILSKSLKTNETLMELNKDQHFKCQRSKGVLEREPEIPTDVSIQIEKKLGGPLKFIDLSLKDLSKDVNLKNIFMQYIRATLRCIKLYESKSTFEELFHCSKNQLDLSFKLLQRLTELNINYTYHKNDSSYIMKKFNIKNINRPQRFKRIEESEKFFNYLVSNGIFNSNNTSNTADKFNNTITDFHIDFNDGPDSETDSEYTPTLDDTPSYLERYMDRYGFTKDEYLANQRLAKAVNYLAALEAEFIQLTENNQRVEHNKIYNYKMLTDFIRFEILNWRAQRPLFNETEKN